MALYYEKEIECFRVLDERKRTQPKEVWFVPDEIWEKFDQSFTRRVLETNKILKEKNYVITNDEGVIVVGLLGMAQTFIRSIKVADKIELKASGEISLCYEICNLFNHCLGNDLNKLTYITYDFMDGIITDEKKLSTEDAYKTTFDLIAQLKTLTKD